VSSQDWEAETFYTYAMELFSSAGHVATSKPEFINHSPERFAYFDNKHNVSLTREQRDMFREYNNISRLFSANGCVFFSINLLSNRLHRSQVAHNIHTTIHPLVGSSASICLFRCDNDVMLSFVGFGLQCLLSDWYPTIDDYDRLLHRLDIANMSISSGREYFIDMVYMLARGYYLSTKPMPNAIIPINYFSAAGIDGIDKETLNDYLERALTEPQHKYDCDYVDYDESYNTSTESISEELDLMLLEMDDEEDDNPFGEELDPEEEDDEDEFYDDSSDSVEKDQYEFENVDQEIFRDPTKMVKWLNSQ
jgi:hypothetical protein